MVIDTFGETLYRTETENIEKFPSPESLKKRILISTKPPKEYQGNTGEVSESEMGRVRNQCQTSSYTLCFNDRILRIIALPIFYL
ncbi:hypothetical protein F3Y22_tig00003715pilonHSYRG00143 [Hibiscus syriacus]|uniref:Phosphatidylinositol-specific phospholipase C X domain-containing protein n=1 Tax=Hibiscus syriacus TaxID=106335 RepID=A0A6A3CPD0_HIBSY|nr:hypothetical protein F3Y22_tig00003715pilonHSYRG00143 [Hibiscus syriacus]